MRYILPLNEYTRNPQNLKSLYKEIYRGIYKITGEKHEYKFSTSKDIGNIKYSKKLSDTDYKWLKFRVQEIAKKHQKKVKSFLDNFKKKLEDRDIVMSYYESSYDAGFDILTLKHGKMDIRYIYEIYLKDAKGKRVKPPHYVYHSSPVKNRNSIKENGLIVSRPNSFKDSYLSYIPSIFASTSNEEVWDDRLGLWEIDTTKISNKWWEDLNLHNNQNWSGKAIMTFENIPPHAIEETIAFTDDEND